MRTLDDHKVNPANDQLTVAVTDEPGVGGASHEYTITGIPNKIEVIRFQNGPINEVGVNGLTHEVLLAIIADRLRCFQDGPYACEENSRALGLICEAQSWLQQRTFKRMRRGVEGTHKP